MPAGAGSISQVPVQGNTIPPNPFVGQQDAGSVQITHEQIPYTDQKARYQIVGSPNGIWDDYRVVNRYENDGHVYMMGTTTPEGLQAAGTSPGNPVVGDTVAFVRLAQPTTLWISDWTVMKEVDEPERPSAFIDDPTWVLLDAHIEPAELRLGTDGVTPIYEMSGTFVYGKRNPSINVAYDAVWPKVPWMMELPGGIRNLSPGKEISDVINQSVQNVAALNAAPPPGAGGPQPAPVPGN